MKGISGQLFENLNTLMTDKLSNHYLPILLSYYTEELYLIRVDLPQGKKMDDLRF
jgi:hypothetical protein